MRVVGNLPYFITSDILLRLFEYRRYFELIVLMVQKEVAERLRRSGIERLRPAFGDHAALRQRRRVVHGASRGISAASQSAFGRSSIDARPRLEKLAVDETDFIRFLKLSFGQKRKTLWNNLKTRYASEDLTRAMLRAKIKPSVRAETLSLEQNAKLFRALTQPAVAQVS